MYTETFHCPKCGHEFEASPSHLKNVAQRLVNASGKLREYMLDESPHQGGELYALCSEYRAAYSAYEALKAVLS